MTPIYFARVLTLAALYILTGKLGLLLAVPPGYATIVWPASGIAVGMLLVHGARLWPGVLLGSFLLNAHNSGVFASGDWLSTQALAALWIASGSTLQALAGRFLVARIVGLPLKLTHKRQIFGVLLLTGPVICVIAPSIGVGALYALGIVPPADLLANWLAWWSGDTLGVVVFMPLVLLAPGSRGHLQWRGTAIGQLPFAALLLLLLPLALTFYAWKATTENDYQRGEAKFNTLAIESEKALQGRIDSYGNALLGAAGFIQGSEQVSRAEWRTYVETVRVRENFPGINGIGWVQVVPHEELERFVAGARADGAPDFAVHPAPVPARPNYIITFIEPDAGNRAALGLNIAFEANRFAAAQRARDSGAAAMTGRVVLVQDEQRSAGFLLLYPIYHRGMPVTTAEQRRAAMRGWTYAPFIASHFLEGLTHSQSSSFRLRIYDGMQEAPDSLFYAGRTAIGKQPAFTVRSTLNIMQRQWLLVFESTPDFERAERSTNPLYILIGGLLFTALLALLLIVLTVRRVEHIEQMVGERRFALPLLVFAVIAAGVFTLHSKLRAQEAAFIAEQVRNEASKIESLLRNLAHERVASLGRMAARWAASGGTPFDQWRADASNHVTQLPGLRTLEWIDTQYRVRWVEPQAGNENVVGLDVKYDTRRTAALEGAAERLRATLTPPLDLVQGYPAFIAYLPLTRHGRFDGFIAGVFSIEEFFTAALRHQASAGFTTTVLYDGREYFSNAPQGALPGAEPLDRALQIEDQAWTLRVAPTPAFVAAQESSLPPLVLAAGLMVAALAALSVRYILISRLKSAHLAKSLALNAGIISSSAHLVIAIDPDYRIMIFNRAAELALGYAAREVIGRRAIPIFLDPKELEERARTLAAETGSPVPVGPRIFTDIPLREGYETREWTFVRKNGSRFPVSVTITPLRDDEGSVTGFIGVIEDITVRKEVERLKNEFTAVVSHELRTPLTSIRGSLGLILGALATNLPQKVRDLLEIAQNNCERLVLLINDILDIEKFSAGQMRFELQTLPVAKVTLQAVEANEGYARKFNVAIELAAIDPDAFVTVDPDRFVQIMSNLLSNAVKYSSPGGTVQVWAERRGDAIRVNVRDHGPGIPEDFRGRIFERFSQADSSTTRDKGGTGLGLHIARRFVEHMQGRIGYESETGQGSTFWVELPVTADVPAGSLA